MHHFPKSFLNLDTVKHKVEQGCSFLAGIPAFKQLQCFLQHTLLWITAPPCLMEAAKDKLWHICTHHGATLSQNTGGFCQLSRHSEHIKSKIACVPWGYERNGMQRDVCVLFLLLYYFVHCIHLFIFISKLGICIPTVCEGTVALMQLCVYAWVHRVRMEARTREAFCRACNQTGVRLYQHIAPVTRWKPGREKVNHWATMGQQKSAWFSVPLRQHTPRLPTLLLLLLLPVSQQTRPQTHI